MAVELRPAYVKVAGQQKQVKTAYVKESGDWKEITSAYAKVDGTWKVIWAPIAVNVSFNQCVDHFCTVQYFDGKIYVQSRQPDRSIHSSRGDCFGNPQGNLLQYQFDYTNQSNMDLTITMSGRCGSGSLRLLQSVDTPVSPRNIPVIDWFGGAAVYSFTITGTIN